MTVADGAEKVGVRGETCLCGGTGEPRFDGVASARSSALTDQVLFGVDAVGDRPG